MSTYSAIFLDLDGTLLDSQKRVSPNAAGLLSALERQGVPVVLCSARPPAGVRLVQRQAGLRGPVICYSGALTLDPEGAVLDQSGIPGQTALDFQDLIRREFPEVVCNTYQREKWLVGPGQQDLPCVRFEAEVTRFQPEVGETGPKDLVHKLLCIGPPEDVARLGEAARRFAGLAAEQSTPTYLEVVAAGVSKRRAAEAFCAKAGIAREAAVACGDYDADMEMLRWAGLGVAMGNAPQHVKAAADLVTESCDRDGVYLALRGLSFAAGE